MALPPDTPLPKRPSFYPPTEAEWHRRISETAYFLAEKRGFAVGHAVEDWLAAEEAVKETLSGTSDSTSSVPRHMPRSLNSDA
jgi:hypothetical protein